MTRTIHFVKNWRCSFHLFWSYVHANNEQTGFHGFWRFFSLVYVQSCERSKNGSFWTRVSSRMAMFINHVVAPVFHPDRENTCTQVLSSIDFWRRPSGKKGKILKRWHLHIDLHVLFNIWKIWQTKKIYKSAWKTRMLDSIVSQMENLSMDLGKMTQFQMFPTSGKPGMQKCPLKSRINTFATVEGRNIWFLIRFSRQFLGTKLP